MNIAFVSYETPFAPCGGIAAVMGRLPARVQAVSHVDSVVITPLLTYGVTVRTLMIRRSDETLRQQLGVYLLSPLMILWGWFIFRPLRVWGMLTCLRLATVAELRLQC